MTASNTATTALRPLRYAGLWRGVGWLMLAVVTIAMAMPAPQIDLNIEQGDKWVHLLVFALLALWSAQIYRPSPTLVRRMFGLIVFAAGTELMQAAIPWRSADSWDLLADAAGLGLGFLLGLTSAGRCVLAAERVFLQFGRQA